MWLGVRGVECLLAMKCFNALCRIGCALEFPRHMVRWSIYAKVNWWMARVWVRYWTTTNLLILGWRVGYMVYTLVTVFITWPSISCSCCTVFLDKCPCPTILVDTRNYKSWFLRIASFIWVRNIYMFVMWVIYLCSTNVCAALINHVQWNWHFLLQHMYISISQLSSLSQKKVCRIVRNKFLYFSSHVKGTFFQSDWN